MPLLSERQNKLQIANRSSRCANGSDRIQSWKNQKQLFYNRTLIKVCHGCEKGSRP